MVALARLEAETHTYHRDADRPWLALLAPDVTRAIYVRQLVRAYGIERPIEAALQHTAHLPVVLGPRTRAGALRRDLVALDVGGLPDLARCWIAPFASVAEACGWLYVLERGARMYAMVAGHVLARIPPLADAIAYLDDAAAPERWRQLGKLLDDIVRSPRAEAQVIAAAHTAFRTVVDWYSTAPGGKAVPNETLRIGA